MFCCLLINKLYASKDTFMEIIHFFQLIEWFLLLHNRPMLTDNTFVTMILSVNFKCMFGMILSLDSMIIFNGKSMNEGRDLTNQLYHKRKKGNPVH